MSDHPDFLRSLTNLFNADPRSTGYAVRDERGWRERTLDDHYDAVAQITLHEGVPPKVVVKFETAKNLNFFSWFVYRFHSAARSQVYECLEFALRMRFADELFMDEEQKRRAQYEQEIRSNPQKAKPYKPPKKEAFRPTMHPSPEICH